MVLESSINFLRDRVLIFVMEFFVSVPIGINYVQESQREKIHQALGIEVSKDEEEEEEDEDDEDKAEGINLHLIASCNLSDF